MLKAAGIILAGGFSKRMGKDKAFLPVPGDEQSTFVETLVVLLAQFCQEIVIVARDMAQAACFTMSGVRVIVDEVPDVGPLMGIYSGLRVIQASFALVIAVDMPFVQPDMVSFLLSRSSEEELLVPIVDDVPQVLLAVYPRSFLPFLEERLRIGRHDPRSLLDVVPVHYVEEAQLRLIDSQLRSFVNLNTPNDMFTEHCN